MPTDPLAPTDPFSRDDILSMTHQPEAPNPVPGIVKPAIDYLTSGDMMPAHKPGTQPKDYLRELLQHPDIMAKNIEQASNFAGMAGTTGAKPPRYLVTSPEGKKYILTGPPEANVLPRNPGRAYDPNRPINPETLAEMREMQEEMGAPDMGGRPIHPDVLKAMREEQEE